MEEETICGIYSLKPIRGKNAINIKYIDAISLKVNESVRDTLIKKYDIKQNVRGEIYACNILHEQLLKSKKQPILYNSIIYEVSSLRLTLLFKIYLYFTIDTDVKTIEQFLNDDLFGSFSYEIVIGDRGRVLEEEIAKFPGNSKTIESLVNLTTDEEMIELIDGLIEEENQRINKIYEEEFEYYCKKEPKSTVSLKDYESD